VPSQLLAINDPPERLYHGLRMMYVYYGQTEQMTANVIRDAGLSDVVANAMQPTLERIGRIQAVLVEDWDISEAQQAALDAVVGHALGFTTWQSLVRQQGLTPERRCDGLSAARRARSGP
jgi:hypothetical protein